MCVIIEKPAGVAFDEADIRAAATRNDDGFGYMYFDPATKRIVTKKGLITNNDDVVAEFKRLTPYHVAYHFRMKTHGKVCDEQAHPFQVLSRDRHGIDMYFMHNGIISDVGSTVDESDTQAFNRLILKPLLGSKPGMIKSAAFKKLIEKYIGTGNKLLFMYGDGKVIKFNESAGTTFKECWVSNTYSFSSARTTTGGNTASRYGYGGYDDEEDKWADYYNSYGSNRSSNVCQLPSTKSEFRLNGDPLAVGDKVYIWKRDDAKFFTEGTVKSISYNTAQISFKKVDGSTITTGFWLQDGESTYNRDLNIDTQEYYALAAQTEQDKQTIVKASEDKKKDTTTSPSSAEETIDDRTSIVKFGDTEIDASQRWAGSYVDLQMDWGGKTLEDLYVMSDQSKADWFNANTKQAFLCLLDLIEAAVEDLVDEQEDIEGDKAYG
jgi:predicted glutamine amidotransferase